MTASRILICFPMADMPGLRAEAAQLALGLAELGCKVTVLGALDAWRYALRRAGIDATECDFATIAQRQLMNRLQQIDPHIIHAVGADAAQLFIPLCALTGSNAMVTLGHADIPGIVSIDYRGVSAIFVPCEQLRDLLCRRFPSTPVENIGYLLPPNEETPDAQRRFLAAELGIADDAPVVLLADRFDADETETALQLIAAAPMIARHIPGAQIIIAGTGVRLPELETCAAEINDRLARRVVILPGHRDDLEQILVITTVAVGSGRFAIEAAGAGVAVVSAGAAGFIGVLQEETMRIAQFTCSGRHGRLEPVTAAELATDIIGLFQYPEYRQQYAAWGRKAVHAEMNRHARLTQLAHYYLRSSAGNLTGHKPKHITTILPNDLRELLFTLPAVSGLRAHYPDARVRCVVASVHQTFITQLGIAEEVLVKPVSVLDWLRVAWKQLQPRANICLDFSQEFSDAVVTALSFAPHRLGFTHGSGALLFSDHLALHAPVSPERALQLTSMLGVSSGAPVAPPTLLTEIQQMVTVSLLAAGVEYGDPLILLCPQSDEALAWPVEHWMTLAAALVANRPERIAMLGAPSSLPDGVVKVMPVQDSMVMTTLLSRACLVIAVDNGPLQLAALLGIPSLGIFGPTSPETSYTGRTNCYPLYHQVYSCQPCWDKPCQQHQCLSSLTPGEVLLAIENIFPQSNA